MTTETQQKTTPGKKIDYEYWLFLLTISLALFIGAGAYCYITHSKIKITYSELQKFNGIDNPKIYLALKHDILDVTEASILFNFLTFRVLLARNR